MPSVGGCARWRRQTGSAGFVMMNVRVICDATLRRKSRGKVKLFLVLRWVKDAGCCYFFMAGGCDACGR